MSSSLPTSTSGTATRPRRYPLRDRAPPARLLVDMTDCDRYSVLRSPVNTLGTQTDEAWFAQFSPSAQADSDSDGCLPYHDPEASRDAALHREYGLEPCLQSECDEDTEEGSEGSDEEYESSGLDDDDIDTGDAEVWLKSDGEYVCVHGRDTSSDEDVSESDSDAMLICNSNEE
jgi:hypothetical protein